MRSVSSLLPLLGACSLTFLASASPVRAETVAVQIGNIPPIASAVVVVVDGNGATYRGEQTLTGGTSSTTVVMGVPAGTGYRARVIAISGGTGIPSSVVAGGKALGATVAAGQLTVIAVSLAVPTLTPDPANPSSVQPASSVTLRWTIHDPARFLDGVAGMRLWWTTDAAAGNATGAQVTGSFTGSIGDDFSYMVTFTAPPTASTLHYQFGEVSPAFNNPDGTQSPLLVLPDRNTGASRLVLSVPAPATGASIQINDIPSVATGVVAVVDGNDATYRAEQSLSAGTTSTTVVMGLPVGSGYRVRVVAITGGNITHPSVVAGGKALGMTVTSGQLTAVAIALAVPTLTPDPANPTSAESGAPVTLRWTIHDPGRFLEGLAGMRLWWTTSPEAENATGVQLDGSLTGSAGDDFSYVVTFAAPSTAGTLHYQFGEVSPSFNHPAGTPAPVLVLPDHNTGASRLTLSVPAPSTGASIQISNIPTIATAVVVVVDGNGATYRAEQMLSLGATSTTVVMGVAGGVGYRVRAIAIAGGNVTHPSVVAGGKALEVTVTSGQLTSLAIALAAPTLTPDPSNPTVVEAASLVTLRWTVRDPAQLLDGAGAMRLWWTTQPAADNVTGVLVVGSFIGAVGDDFSYMVMFSAPATPTTLYYQFGRGAGPFNNPSGSQAPLLILPDRNTGASRLPLTVDIRPFPPTGVVATPAGYYRARVTWTAATGATSYTIKRGDVSGGEITLAGITGTEFIDYRVTRGRQYFYVVASVNSVGESVNSAEAHVTILDLPARSGDFDGDNRSEITIWRPSTGEWFTRLSSTSYAAYGVHALGQAGDRPVPADYDGDGRNEIAIWRPSTGDWFIRTSTTGFTNSWWYNWGMSGDVPVPADYDGDGCADIAIWRPSTGQWFIRMSTSGYAGYASYEWGGEGDTPVTADFDGDLRAEIGIWRPSTGRWYVRWSTTDYSTHVESVWGEAGDTPLTGDFDGDGRAEIGIWRPSDGRWYILTSASNWADYTVYVWGGAGDTVVDADFDGDGLADLVAWRPSTGEWFVRGSASHYATYERYVWGASGDVAVPAR